MSVRTYIVYVHILYFNIYTMTSQSTCTCMFLDITTSMDHAYACKQTSLDIRYAKDYAHPTSCSRTMYIYFSSIVPSSEQL